MKTHTHKNFFYRNVHSSLIYNSPTWKQTKCPPTDEKANTVYSYNQILLKIKINELLIHNNTKGEFQKDVKWKKPTTTLSDYIFYTF